jgi:hypothetical protein
VTYEIQSAKNGETIELFEAADDEEAIEHARRETPGNWNLFRLVASNDSDFGFEFKGEGPPPSSARSYDPGEQLVMAGRRVSLALASRDRERKVLAVAIELRQRAIDLGREVGPYLKLVKGEVDSDVGMEAAAQKLWALVDARKHFSELAVASNGEVFGKPANAGGS